MENPHDKNPDDEVLVVCLPVVIFTKADADAIKAMCPIKLLPGHNNIIAVTAFWPPEGLAGGFATVRVMHHVRKLKNDKEKLQAQWDVKVPIGRVIMDSDDKSTHICRVQLKESDKHNPAGTGLRIDHGKIIDIRGDLPPRGTILGPDGSVKG